MLFLFFLFAATIPMFLLGKKVSELLKAVVNIKVKLIFNQLFHTYKRHIYLFQNTHSSLFLKPKSSWLILTSASVFVCLETRNLRCSGSLIDDQKLAILHLCVCTQSCLILCNPVDCNWPGSSVHVIFQARNAGVGCYFLFQRIFLTQGSNPCLLCLLYWQANSFTCVTWEAPVLHLELYNCARHPFIIFFVLPLTCKLFKGKNYASYLASFCCLPKEKPNTGRLKGRREH